MMQYEILSILTPFLLKRPKNEAVQPKKTKSGKGGCGGSEDDNLGQIFYSTSYFTDFSAVMYLCVVKESINKSSQKIGPSVFVKMATLC